jgi:hypothetical protein
VPTQGHLRARRREALDGIELHFADYQFGHGMPVLTRALVGTHRRACSGHDGAYALLTSPQARPIGTDPFRQRDDRPPCRPGCQQTAHSKLVVFAQFGVDFAATDATVSRTMSVTCLSIAPDGNAMTEVGVSAGLYAHPGPVGSAREPTGPLYLGLVWRLAAYAAKCLPTWEYRAAYGWLTYWRVDSWRLPERLRP